MPGTARRITLWTKKEILALFKSAKRFCYHPGIDIRVTPKKQPLGRLLIVTPKKMGNAPERNRVRRRLKAIFYENKLYDLGFDWLFFAKPGIADVPFSQLKDFILTTCLPQLPKL